MVAALLSMRNAIETGKLCIRSENESVLWRVKRVNLNPTGLGLNLNAGKICFSLYLRGFYFN